MSLGYRRATITINDLVIDGLRCVFEIDGQGHSSMPIMVLRVFGVKRDTFNAIPFNESIVFEVKRPDMSVSEVLFYGTIRDKSIIKMEAEQVITIFADGATKEAREKISHTWKADTKAKTIIEWFSSNMKEFEFRYKDDFNNLLESTVFHSGYTIANEFTYSSLKRFLREELGLDCMIYNRKVFVYSRGEISEISTTHRVTVQTGLIGAPSRGINYTEATVTLNPVMKHYDAVYLQSNYFSSASKTQYKFPSGKSQQEIEEEYNKSEKAVELVGASGSYIIEDLQHRGDTHSNLWETKLQLIDWNVDNWSASR